MVCFNNSISLDQHVGMAKSVTTIEPCVKLRQINQVPKNKKALNSPNPCRRSRWAVFDFVILIAVVCACGFLLFPYLKFVLYKIGEILGLFIDLVKEEVMRARMINGCLGLSILFAVIAVMAISICTSKKCGKPGCRGLRKGAEFDIQLETEECLSIIPKNSSKSSTRKGLFELPRDHHLELEQELKKMAPPNGRAVLVFRGRCGCSVGRMEVPGPRKSSKFKK